MPRKYTPNQVVSAFWAKVDKSAGADACWIWTACRDHKGYGQLRIHSKSILAHRYAYILEHGEIPDGMFVCHHCDNPSCVNPTHLFLGTNTDNVHDMMAKGRNMHITRPETLARGERHGRYTKPERTASGERNGSRLHPERLSRGETHYSRTNPELLARGERNGNSKLAEIQVREILHSFAHGNVSKSELARKYHVSRVVIRAIINGKIWKHVTD